MKKHIKKNGKIEEDKIKDLKLEKDEEAINPKENKVDEKSPVKRALFVLLGFLVVAVVIIILSLKSNNDEEDKISVVYSENQQRVINNFGTPQTFKLVRKDGETLEYWRYLYLDEVFIFQNGEFVASQHFNFDVEENEGIYLDLEPADFYDKESIEDVNKLVESEPSLVADIDDGILGEGYKFYSYTKLLDITTYNNLIEVVNTVAVKESDENKENQINVTEDDVEQKGKVFVGASDLENSSFSYYLDDERYRYIKQRSLITDDDEKAFHIYGYCYTLDEGESFTDNPQDPYACADNESLLWTIEMYNLDVYDSLGDMDKQYFDELARNDEFVYVLSHSNGDFPAELPSWINTLDKIKNDFSVPMAAKYYEQIHQK